MSKILKLINKLHPIGFAIVFLVIFSIPIYLVDKELSEKRLEAKMEHLSIDVTNYFSKVLGTKLSSLVSDSLTRYWFVDTSTAINMLGINTPDTADKIPGIMAGYIKARYSDEQFDEGIVDITKMYLGKIPNIPLEEQITRNANGTFIYPDFLVTTHKDSAFVANNILKFLNNNLDVFYEFNSTGGGTRRYLYLDVNNFGTDKLYIPFITPTARRVNEGNITMVYINLVRYILYPLDNLMDGLKEYNIHITVKNNQNGKYILGDSITAENLFNEIHSRRITVNLDRGNYITVTFVPTKAFPRERAFFPYIYIILFIISILFCVTLWFFLKQIKEREIALERSNTELKTATTVKRKFLSIITNDIQNPVAGMLNISTLFGNYYNNPTIKEADKSINKLVKAINKLFKSLENLQQWMLIYTDDVKLNISQNNIHTIIKSTLENIEIQAQDEGIELFFEDNIAIATDVYCDAKMINTVLQNLISNAIKFSGQGKKVIVQTNNHSNNKYITVTVKDEGIGMNEETLSKLFQLDVDVKTKSFTNKYSSDTLGLGLILCKEIIDKHNTEIWAESEIGKGSEFKFTLLKQI